MPPFNTVNILGIDFPILDYRQTLALFQQWIDAKTAHQVCICNVHTVVTSMNDAELLAINRLSLCTMDGLPLVWYANRVRGANIAERVCGPDLMLKCLDQGRERGWTHYFLGGTPEVLQDLVEAIRRRYPGVDIAGWHSPPFRALSAEEDRDLVAQINAAAPDFLWVGLGAPKQEKWIASHLEQLRVPVQLGVGAAFDFHSGHVERAPRWMQKIGLEWLYRMLKDKRLIKRYCTTNPVFLWLFARDMLRARLSNWRSG